MLFYNTLLSLLCATSAAATTLARGVEKRDTPKVLIDPALWPLIVRYANFTSASYWAYCPRPPYGSVFVNYTSIPLTDTQAALYRSDANKELVLSFPGSTSLPDFFTDFLFFPVAYTTPGVSNCNGCNAHVGFLIAWNSVYVSVTQMLDAQLKLYPKYNIVVTGHSLGGAIAQLAFASLKGLNYTVTKGFTYGQPRVGNVQFADWFDKLAGASDTAAGIGSYYRSTHTIDGVPQEPPWWTGFQHSRTEFFEQDPESAGKTYRCFGREASDCNLGAAQGFLNAAHGVYAGINMGDHTVSCGW